MRMVDIIIKKKAGEALTDEEIRFFVEGITDGSIPDYQASAFCMAVCFQGMTPEETDALTRCIASSGDMLDLSRFGDLSCDKHSTGGVGDKTTLIVAPIVASLGGYLAKMSGRGLGHTGGTVDKLESIPGYNTALSEENFMNQVETHRIAVIGQTGNLTPADKKLYALRDVTGTVESIPLITSSIMGKKLAAGSKNIVLDVKVGSGAFMKTIEDASVLAEKMVEIGKRNGRRIAAVLTDMDTPLGTAIGNALEIQEAVEVLSGRLKNDLYEVSMVLAATLVSLAFHLTPEEARKQAEEAVDSGRAYRKMQEWVEAQGGDVSYIQHPEKFPKTSSVYTVQAPQDGYVGSMDAAMIGSAAMVLGAGRASKEDVIDHSAGIVLEKKTGDRVRAGQTLAVLYTNRAESIPEAASRFLKAITLTAEKPALKPLVYRIIR